MAALFLLSIIAVATIAFLIVRTVSRKGADKSILDFDERNTLEHALKGMNRARTVLDETEIEVLSEAIRIELLLDELDNHNLMKMKK